MATSNIPHNYIRYLAVYGCMATGLIYLGIGVIAILSYMRIKDGGADETSLLSFLNEYTAGKILVWIILLGTVSYVLWRIFEAITDPYEYGGDAKGLLRRTGIGLSSTADALIAYSALQILFGAGEKNTNGEPDEYRNIVSGILEHDGGQLIIIITGLIILATAVVQFIYGVTRGYKERLDIAHFSAATKKAIHGLAWVGYLSRGIILGITGLFLTKAGIASQAHHVVNTDKAFDFIGDNIGGVAFILVATGTICYSLFMFSLGVTYDADKD
jgi:hypothetical protein